MKTIKEKPKGGKPKGKGKAASQPALTQRQAAKLLRDKYVQQLDQRPEGREGQTEYATDQVEAAERFAVDELTQPRSPRQRNQQIKEKPQSAQAPTEPSAAGPEAPPVPETPPQGRTTTPSPQERAANVPKERAAQTVKTRPTAGGTQGTSPAPQGAQQASPQPAQRTVKIKERPAVEIKEAGRRADAPLIKDRSSLNIHRINPSIKSDPAADRQPSPQAGGRAAPRTDTAPASPRTAASRRADHFAAPGRASTLTGETPAATGKSVKPAPAQRMVDSAKCRLSTSRQTGTTARASPSITARGAAKSTTAPAPGRQALKVRTNTKGPTPKIRGKIYPKGAASPKTARAPLKTAAKPIRTVKQSARQRMTRQAMRQTARQAGSAARKTALLLKRAVQAVAKATASLVSALVGLAGGGILLIALVVVIIVGAIASSPFGLFFAQEPNAPGTVSVAQAVGTVNMAYNSRLELLQAGDYDNIVIHGQAPDWAEVLAVFAVKSAGAEVDGLDVATLDADRVSKLTAVFWDMTGITVEEETIDHPATDTAEAWTEKVLHITITPQTADDMRVSYAFSEYQNSALDELLSDRAALSSLAGSLAITDADVREIIAALPDGLEQARRDTVHTALQLVGKVNYFWGGKSRAIGWDSRWGQLTKVWAVGSSSTGTYRPFGLDCSGFVDWTFNNSLGYIIGHGGGVIMQHRYCTNITQAEAQPGDLAFYPDDSHIGIIVGRNAAGKLLVCHCASGQNNVVVTEFSASGFTAVGRPDIFDP